MRLTFWLAALLSTLMAWADPATMTKGSQRMEITVERMEGGQWKTVDPSLVFTENDQIRFRFRANFAGYLYVMNQSTSGNYTQLFPREDTGRQNRINNNREYLVPATDGSFRVAGPAGHDILYWMVSPIEIGGAPGGSPVPPPPERSVAPLAPITPRCDDTLFRARGECLDSSAGPKGLTNSRDLPPNLMSVAQQPPENELYFIRDRKSAVVASPKPLSGPVIYEFHLAHKAATAGR